MHIRDIVRSVSMYYSACIAGVLSASLVLASSACMNASAAWFDDPSVKASVDIGTKTDPHYINLSEDGAYLMVDTHASNTAFPVQVYSVAELRALSGATNRVAMASALAGDFFGAGTGDGGWKGGAISAKLGLMIPGSGKSFGALYTAFDVPAFGWKAGENAFQIGGLDGAGFDGLDFNAAGTRLYVNQYANGNRNKILAYDTASLKSAHSLALLSTNTVDGVTRIRNLSCYTIGGKDLVYFGEGAVSGTNNSVYVYDPAEDTVTTLVTDANLFDDDIMNVKLSHVATGCPTMYVQTDNGRLHIFLLAPDGKSVTNAKPVKSFTPAECATLCGLSALPSNTSYVKFRNFEVTDDGETAFFLFHNSNGTNSPGLCVVKADAYVASTGAQAINTGYRVNSKTKMEIDFQIDTVVNQRYVFGASGSEGTICCLWVNSNGNLEPNCGGWCGNIGGSATTTRRTIVYDLPNRIIELYEHGSASPLARKDSTVVKDNGESNCPIALFANTTDASGAAAGFGTCRIYSFKVWEGTTLVHDWQPAVKGGEAGFVDAVDGSFIGQTTPGADLTASGDYATLEGDDAPYIESDGTTVVNTGVKPSPELRVEIDYALSTTDQSDVRIAGTAGSGQTFEFYVNSQAGLACCIAKGWKSQYIGPVDTRRHTFIADVQENKCSFVTGDSTNLSFSANAGGTSIDAEGAYPIGLFGRITGANGATDWAAGRSKARIYGVRFFKNGEPFKNFVPCVKGDVAGFRDTIGGLFHSAEFNVAGLSSGGNVERIPDDGYVELCGNDETQADALKGGHYFDTGYTPGPNTRIELDYALAENHSAVAADWYLLNAGNGTEAVALYQNANAFGACLGTAMWKGVGLPSQANAALVRRTAVLDSQNKAVTMMTAGYANYANTNATFTAFSANAATSIKLGSTAGGGGGYTPLRIYGLRIYESGSLVREYVPYVKNGAPGLKYGNTFVKVSWNANLGAAGLPKAGGDIDVSTDRDRDAFALFTGAQSIDTGYKPTPNMKLVADFAFANAHNKTQQFVFEATGNGTCRLYTADSGGANATYRYIFCSSWKTDSIGSIACDHQRRLITIDAPNNQMRFSPGATDGSTYNGDSTLAGWTKPSCSTALKIASASSGTANYAKIRLYRFTIYDNGAKVREYVPAVVDGVAGLYDLEHKDAALLTAAGLTVSGRGHDGAEEWIIKPQNVNLTRSKGSTTLKALAIGAQSYKWTKNGEPVSGGANGSLDVMWTKGGATDVYSVTPIYEVFGEESEGTPVQVSVANEPPGMVIILR